MADQTDNDSPRREVKYEGTPSFLKAFIICAAAMGVYLAIILITSPGAIKKHKKSDDHADKAKHEAS